MQSDSIKKILTVAVGVCLVCAVLVSTVTVSLKSKQEINKKLDKLKNILVAGDLFTTEKEIEKNYNSFIKNVILELETGKELDINSIEDILKPENFDIKKLANSSKYGKKIDSKKDLANIKIMPKIMNIFEVVVNGKIEKYIFPIYGKGLWSTMYGFIALDKNLKEVKGITFYEHGETPGLGGEIENPNWQKIWQGKQVFSSLGEVELTVIKGVVDKNSDKANFLIDGLSGSTLTTRGVDNTIKFWLGENGYGPFIKLKKGGINE